MLLDALVVGSLDTNCYLVGCERTRACVVIDPGADADTILARLAQRNLSAQWIALTHSHFDHILAVPEILKKTGARLAIHSADADTLHNPPAWCRAYLPDLPAGISADRLLAHGDRFAVGDRELQVIHTPGHTPGGISLWIEREKVLFAGDTLFREGIGRADLHGGDGHQLLESIARRLLSLPDETIVYPGHGPSTTIAHEKRNNRWLNPIRS